MATKKDDGIKVALDSLTAAATALACHGAGGYSVDTSALDAVFVRCLVNLRNELDWCDEVEYYDPDGDIQALLRGEI